MAAMVSAIICGFQWRGDEITHENLVTELHIHECQIPDEHEEFSNNTHVCYCGDSKPCMRDEQSYEEYKLSVQATGDEECPF